MCNACSMECFTCSTYCKWLHTLSWACALTGSLLWNKGATPFLMFFSRRVRNPLCFMPMALRSCVKSATWCHWSVIYQLPTASSVKVCNYTYVHHTILGYMYVGAGSMPAMYMFVIRTYVHTSMVVPQINSNRVYPCASKFGMNAWSDMQVCVCRRWWWWWEERGGEGRRMHLSYVHCKIQCQLQ